MFFHNNRTATIRQDDQTSDLAAVKIGVLQGSPAVLIVFILFIALLFEILTKEDKRAGIKICSDIDDGLLIVRDSIEDKITPKI